MNQVCAKKRLGQHFLTDGNVAKKIVNSLSFEGYRTVVEVGPGMGVLSCHLLKRCDDLFLVEIDSELVAYLQANQSELSDRIIQGDFLKWDPETRGLSCFALIGNFPYNISSQILFWLLVQRQYVPECVGMFQKEVAERIAAQSGNKIYGILSVLIQAFYEVSFLFTVNEKVFSPPPRIKSAVVRLRRKVHQIDCDEAMFFKLVKAAFNQRRKTLRNALKTLYRSDAFYRLLILDKRAEQLSVEDFIALTRLASAET
ncbi:MAG: 16S rRNA (adenine(1518)-N(6)/adenine(1519)-N(6))-dimethyltransferase RsmA [Flavobacteriales bacterium AspAUS03]